MRLLLAGALAFLFWWGNMSAGAFVVNHHDTVMSQASLVAGSNLVPDGDFQLGETIIATCWTDSGPDWSENEITYILGPSSRVATAPLLSGGTAAPNTLESKDRIAVTEGASYYASAQVGIYNAMSGNQWNARAAIRVRWWAAASGGSPIKVDVLYDANPTVSRQWLVVSDTLTAPTGADYASIQLESQSRSATQLGDETLQFDNIFFAQLVEPARPPFIERLPYVGNGGTGTQHQNLNYSKQVEIGYKDCTFELTGHPADLAQWLNNLEHHIEIYHQGVCVWEGLVWSVDVTIGGFTRRVTLDTLRNYARIYAGASGEMVNGTPNPDSIARYGRCDYYEESDTLSRQEAIDKANTILSTYAWPIIVPVGEPSPGAPDSAKITCMGYGAALSLIRAAQFNAGAGLDSSETLTQILEYIHRLNPFISNDYGLIQATGRTSNVQGGQVYGVREAINQLISRGNSDGRTLIAGVWADRKFVLKPRPTTVDYQLEMRDGLKTFLDSGRNPIPAARVEPGHFVRYPTPVPNFASFASTPLRDPTLKYIGETQYDAEQDYVQDLAAAATTLEAGLAGAFNTGL